MSEMDPFEGIDMNSILPKEKPKAISKKKPVNMPIINIPDKHDNSTEEKSDLIHKIQLYGKNKRFARKLRESKHNFSISYLNKKNVTDLKLELERIDLTLASGQNSNIVDYGILHGLSFVEKIVNDRTNYKINGTVKKCFEDEYFLDVLERAKMKYGIGCLKMDPLMELSIFIAQTSLTVHHSNKFMSSLNDASKGVDLSEEIKE
jgi:hypothetical protein